MNRKTRMRSPAGKRLVCICMLLPLSLSASNTSTDSQAGGTWKDTAHGALLYPQTQDDKPTTIDWPALIKGQPPLQNPRKDRWPLILFTNISQEPLDAGTAQAVLERGFTQHIKLDVSWISQALALKKAGSPIIIMEGKDFRWPANLWPYNLAGNEDTWAHRYPSNMPVPAQWKKMPVPTYLKGWHTAANQTREILAAFKNERITVDAVWLDYE